jgi:signal peptidase I
LKRFLNWAVFVSVVSAVYFVAGPTSLGGPASYVIVDGTSMEPTYYDGDLVIAVERDAYGIGDNIVYDAPVDHQFNVIHRIIEKNDHGFVTQGDNRDEPDGWVAPHESIYGAARFHLPNGGALITLLRQPAVIVGLLAGLIAFEILKRREQRHVESPDEDPATRLPSERAAEMTR